MNNLYKNYSLKKKNVTVGKLQGLLGYTGLLVGQQEFFFIITF